MGISLKLETNFRNELNVVGESRMSDFYSAVEILEVHYYSFMDK